LCFSVVLNARAIGVCSITNEMENEIPIFEWFAQYWMNDDKFWLWLLSFFLAFSGTKRSKIRLTEDQIFNVFYMLNREIISFVKFLKQFIHFCNFTNEDTENFKYPMIMTCYKRTENTGSALSQGVDPITIHQRVSRPYPAWSKIFGHSFLSRVSSVTDFHQSRFSRM
jgi:hypothetical protein